MSSPGLGALPAPQTITFSGTLTGAALVGNAPVVVNDTCTFSGSSGPTGDNVAAGLGSAVGSCAGSLPVSAALTFVRVGAVVVLEGNAVVAGSAAIPVGACLFIPPAQLPPLRSYTLLCAVAVVAA